MEVTIKAVIKPRSTETPNKDTSNTSPSALPAAADDKKTKYSKKFPEEKPAEDYLKKLKSPGTPASKPKQSASPAK